DFCLAAWFDADPLPSFVEKRVRRYTMPGHPLHKHPIRSASRLTYIEDEKDVTVLACVDSAHSSARHAAAGDAASASGRRSTTGRPKRRRIRERPQQSGLHGNIDVLPGVCEFAMIVSDQRTGSCIHSGPHWGLGERNAKRHLAGFANKRYQTAHRHEYDVAGFVIAVRSCLAKRSYGNNHESRIELRTVQ